MADAETDGGNVYTMVTAASSVALLAVYYIFNVAQKPKIYTSNIVLQKFLEEYMPSLRDKYYPSWFSWEGRLQSVLGLNLRISSTEKLNYSREILRLKDGGQLGLDFLGEQKNDEADSQSLIVLLLPGLTSTSNTSYVKTLAMTIVNTGAVVAVLNNRGLGGVDLLTPRTYCCTNSEDIREVIAHLKMKYPKSKMMAVGTSLGGMTLSRYLINWPEEAKDTFVAALDPIIGNASLETPFLNKYIVNYALTSNLKNLAKRHRSVLEPHSCWDLNRALSVNTIREFDDSFTSPMFGFDSVEAYYTAAQITPEIHKFSIPVVGLNAMDDPMQPGQDLPLKEAEQPGSKLAMIVTEKGGHLGFLESAFPIRSPFHFMERVVSEFVQAIQLHSDDLAMSVEVDKLLRI